MIKIILKKEGDKEATVKFSLEINEMSFFFFFSWK